MSDERLLAPLPARTRVPAFRSIVELLAIVTLADRLREERPELSESAAFYKAAEDGTLKIEPAGPSEPACGMKLGSSVVGPREHTVEHDEMVVEVSVERGSEAMQKRQSPKPGVPGCAWAGAAQRGADGPHEDPQHSAGDLGIVMQEGPQALGHGGAVARRSARCRGRPIRSELSAHSDHVQLRSTPT